MILKVFSNKNDSMFSFQLSKSLPEQESPQALPSRSTVCDGTSNGKSGEGHLLQPTGVAQEAARPLGAASVDVPSAVAAEQGQSWLSRPQHPVCVDNGCFGNAKHLQRGAPGLGLRAGLPARQQGTACRPEPPRNEPQEDSYISTESPLRLEGAAHSGGLQPPDSTPENQAAPSSEPLESLVGVRSPLLIQQQVDGEQKQDRMLQKDGRDGGGFPLHVATVLIGSRTECAAQCPSCLAVRMESGSEGDGFGQGPARRP